MMPACREDPRDYPASYADIMFRAYKEGRIEYFMAREEKKVRNKQRLLYRIRTSILTSSCFPRLSHIVPHLTFSVEKRTYLSERTGRPESAPYWLLSVKRKADAPTNL